MGTGQLLKALHQQSDPEPVRGFRKVLTGPEHPDCLPFCQGPGHGTGYQDQIIIEAKDFLTAIDTGQAIWPTFRDGLAVSHVVGQLLKAVQQQQNRSAFVNTRPSVQLIPA